MNTNNWTLDEDGDWSFQSGEPDHIDGLVCIHHTDGFPVVMQCGHEMGKYETLEEAKAALEAFAEDIDLMRQLNSDWSPMTRLLNRSDDESIPQFIDFSGTMDET